MNADKEKRVEMQLSLIRWHLDAAISGTKENALIHIKRAREAHARICGSLAHAGLSKEVQARLEQECSELKARLDALSGS